MIYQGTALVPGSCGELVQGTISGRHFLVPCPVNCYSRVTVTVSPTRSQIIAPPNRSKAAQAVRKVLNNLGYPGFGALIEVASLLPVGKGMASSTADLAAACYATASALGIGIEPRLVGKIALEIEPSDGTFNPGITLFDHVRGELYENLGAPVPLGILVLDFGGVVDTLEFNRRVDLPFYNRLNETDTNNALDLVRTGIRLQDPKLVGQGATLSALANQKILPKPRLEQIIDFTSQRGAYGVNVAHSGTVAGILLPEGQEGDQDFVKQLTEHFPEIGVCYSLRLTQGGPRYLGNMRHRRGENCEASAWWKYQPDCGKVWAGGRAAN